MREGEEHSPLSLQIQKINEYIVLYFLSLVSSNITHIPIPIIESIYRVCSQGVPTMSQNPIPGIPGAPS